MLLFNECSYLEKQFPEPQYLGAKYRFRSWIDSFIDHEKVTSALDAFGGSQSIAYYFKQCGFRTITNDFLNFNNQIGLGLIENDTETLNENDISILFSQNQNPDYYNLWV